MKKIKIISSFILLLGIKTTFAQGVFPFLPDLPSDAGSTALIAEHAILTANEKKLQKELAKFTRYYSTRLLYNIPISGGTYKQKVKILLDKVDNRFQSVQLENNKLSFTHYSSKRKNNEALNIIKSNLTTSRNELYHKLKIAGVNGEKENLYLNFAKNMLRVHQKLDTIESNIQKSNRLKSIILTIKNR